MFDLHDVQAAFTRPVFVNHLTQNWLPALPDVQRKLDCGRAGSHRRGRLRRRSRRDHDRPRLPERRVDGYDLDDASIAAAQQAAAAAGVADRARFERRDAADPTISGDYDLVMAIEMLHDVPDPVGILRTMKTLAGEPGTVLVVDERTEETFTVPANEMERFFYSFSTLHCLAVSMQDGGAGTGTVIRPRHVRDYATRRRVLDRRDARRGAPAVRALPAHLIGLEQVEITRRVAEVPELLFEDRVQAAFDRRGPVLEHLAGLGEI